VSDLFYLLATGGRTCMSGAACMKMWSMFLILPSTLEYTWSTLKLKLLPDDAARLAFLCSNKICVNHWMAYCGLQKYVRSASIRHGESIIRL